MNKTGWISSFYKNEKIRNVEYAKVKGENVVISLPIDLLEAAQINERSVNSETGLTIFQEKLKYLVENDYYAEEFLSKYTFNQMKSIFKKHIVTNSVPHPS